MKTAAKGTDTSMALIIVAIIVFVGTVTTMLTQPAGLNTLDLIVNFEAFKPASMQEVRVNQLPQV